MVKIGFRINIHNITFFGMVAKTQRLEGITSLIGKDKHIILWDLEGCTLKQAEKTLRRIQINFGLSNIYIVSDFDKSYRAYCFSYVHYITYLYILLSTEYLDWLFFKYTVKRDKATLRTSNKLNREPQKLVSVLESWYIPIPKKFESVIYDTGLSKTGHIAVLGFKKEREELG